MSQVFTGSTRRGKGKMNKQLFARVTIAVLLTALLLSLTFLIKSEAQGPVSVTLDDANGLVGSTSTVGLSIGSEEEVSFLQIWLMYDGSVISLDNARKTSRTSSYMTAFAVDSSVITQTVAHILMYNLSGATVAPSLGSVVDLDFAVVGSEGEQSTISVVDMNLSSRMGTFVPVNYSAESVFTVDVCQANGDINNDGEINVLDLGRLIPMLPHATPDYQLFPEAEWCRADLETEMVGNFRWNVFDYQRLKCLVMGTCQ